MTIESEGNIVIFGAGSYGISVYKYYSRKYNIVAFLDNDNSKQNGFIGSIPILSPNQISDLEYDKIFIASMSSQEIFKELTQGLGVSKKKIYIVPASIIQEFTSFDTKSFNKAFLEAIDIFNNKKINYWVDHSTLLGLVRGDKVLYYDIDLSITIDELPLVKRTFTNVFSASDVEYSEYGFDYKYWSKNQVKMVKLKSLGIDINVKIPNGNNIYWLIGPYLLRIPSSFYSGHDIINYNNKPLKVPLDYIDYLNCLYGEWRIPATNWTHSDYNNIVHCFSAKDNIY